MVLDHHIAATTLSGDYTMDQKLVLVEATYTVTNIIATIKAQPSFLRLLSINAGLKFNPSKFPAAFKKLKKGSCNIFGTGTITLIRFKSISDLQDAPAEVAEKLGCHYKQLTITLKSATLFVLLKRQRPLQR